MSVAPPLSSASCSHTLFLESAFTETRGKTIFQRIKAPSHADIEVLLNIISYRIAPYLKNAGLIQRGMDNRFIDLPVDHEDSLLRLQAASVNCCIAIGADNS